MWPRPFTMGMRCGRRLRSCWRWRVAAPAPGRPVHRRVGRRGPDARGGAPFALRGGLEPPRDGAVYLTPEQAWGLKVWRHSPPPEVVARSLAAYDVFYQELRRLLDEKVCRYGRFVAFDIHSYNHRRSGPNAPAADPARNPEINLGTGTIPRQYGTRLVQRVCRRLARRRSRWRPAFLRRQRYRGDRAEAGVPAQLWREHRQQTTGDDVDLSSSILGHL